MNLREYLSLFQRRWLLIVATALAVVALAAVVTFAATPTYASNARVFVSTADSGTTSSSDSAYQGGMAATQKVKSYASLVSDGELASRVIDRLDLDTTAAKLSDHLSAQVVPETQLLEIRVTDDDARQAQRINRAVVGQLLDMIRDIETPPGASTPLLKGTVVGQPTLDTDPVSPKPVRNLALGLLVGLILGAGVALTRELLDSTVSGPDDVEKALDTSMLGAIADDPEAPKVPLVSALSPHAPRIEAFRVLRTNLQFVDVDAAHKAVVITSSVPGEGKSTTAVNVAITMAQAGQRVLLIDGDLRRPQVATMLGLEQQVGVTTVLLGRTYLEDSIQRHYETGLEVLTSGLVPPNPAELLQSRAMSELLSLVREDYDFVVIDSPPLLPVTDAALLAAQTDGAVVVVHAGSTTREQLAVARERLTGVDARILGGVLTRVKRGKRGAKYGYGYGYGYAPHEENVPAPTEPVAPAAGLRQRNRSAVAEVLPLRGRSADLARTGTTDATAPGRHRG